MRTFLQWTYILVAASTLLWGLYVVTSLRVTLRIGAIVSGAYLVACGALIMLMMYVD